MEYLLRKGIKEALKTLYKSDVPDESIQLQKTRKEFSGDITLVVFPLLKISRSSPEQTANDLGEFLLRSQNTVSSFNVIKGFLNITLAPSAWTAKLKTICEAENYGFTEPGKDAEVIVIEYSSPNTNKPLHLGHIRNNLLGFSLSRLTYAAGKKVIRTNIVNDRGIHICKSMVAWKLFSDGETPEKSGKKGDHLVGEYYVLFDRKYKEQMAAMEEAGSTPEEARDNAGLMLAAREMLIKWEAGDAETMSLWKMMNSWVYAGFDVTYKALGVEFDRIYYESDTYKTGKQLVLDALSSDLLFRKDDGSVWVDLATDNLDQKLLLRSDGTAVYMTQDLGTAVIRYNDYKFDRHIYVVGNEQNYHFQVLALVLLKMGYPWAHGLHHFSYGMVELPEGKMKSREGKVVDADDLITEMTDTARTMSQELGKLGGFTVTEKEDIFRKIGLAALKYFILKVDPKKNMTFNPAESIDFNGNTGPFIQYTYARIKSVLKKGEDTGIIAGEPAFDNIVPDQKEINVIKLLNEFPSVVSEAAEGLSPALVANYCYDLAREFNQFYHDLPILGEEKKELRDFRLKLTEMTGKIIEKGLWLLGIEAPDRM
ncbi:MAG TPA: arginine--tRNA ligase [Bacteroidales bacterium]|nr:arginine--tRNA ligase [Bacteroidales bacterium]